MFTGLVEELGTVRSIRQGSRSAQLDLEAGKILADVKLGDSIAVNGVCLTVTAFDRHRFSVDVMAETLKRTNLGRLKSNDRVNLERAMQMGDRLGGHLVSGHIDRVGTITRQERVDIALVTWVDVPRSLLKFVIPKGSVAVDGISLTVVEVSDSGFSVSLIPHTAKLTTLGFKTVGHSVNVEVDMLAKYVARMLKPWQEDNKESGLTKDFLQNNGFI